MYYYKYFSKPTSIKNKIINPLKKDCFGTGNPTGFLCGMVYND